jgi:hypothetical protein
MTEAELNRTLNPWGRPPLHGGRRPGQGVAETSWRWSQDMLQAIAVKYNLKDKGLDRARCPRWCRGLADVLRQAVAAAPPPPPGGGPAPPPLPREWCWRSRATRCTRRRFPSAPETGLVSEELLPPFDPFQRRAGGSPGRPGAGYEPGTRHHHVARRAAARLPRGFEGQSGSPPSPASSKEATRLRRIMQELGNAGELPPHLAGSLGSTCTAHFLHPVAAVLSGTAVPASRSGSGSGAARGSAAHAATAGTHLHPRPHGRRPPHPTAATASSFDGVLREALRGVQWAFDARASPSAAGGAEHQPAPGVRFPTCTRPSPACWRGIAMEPCRAPPWRCVRSAKPVLLRTKEGEVKRDFLMAGAGPRRDLHPGRPASGSCRALDQGAVGTGLQDGARDGRLSSASPRCPAEAWRRAVFLPTP